MGPRSWPWLAGRHGSGRREATLGGALAVCGCGSIGQQSERVCEGAHETTASRAAATAALLKGIHGTAKHISTIVRNKEGGKEWNREQRTCATGGGHAAAPRQARDGGGGAVGGARGWGPVVRQQHRRQGAQVVKVQLHLHNMTHEVKRHHSACPRA